MKLKYLFISVLIFCCAAVSHAEVSTCAIFGSNMVLQMNQPVQVWGTALPGEKVQVVFNGQKLSAKADKSGKWDVLLEPMAPGGPYTMTVKGKSNTITYNNILVGEVWLCSGQSNMEWQPGFGLDNFDYEKSIADNPQIRCFSVVKDMGGYPEDDIEGNWDVCTPENFPHFTAVGYFFARKMWEETGVPVGIINSSWGGTDIEAWTSAESYEALKGQVASVDYDPAFIQSLSEMKRSGIKPRPEAYNAAYNDDPAIREKWYADPGNPGLWKAVDVPQERGATLLSNSDGHVWFRYDVELTDEEAGEPARLCLGMIDDNDISWINGVEVGRTNGHTYQRRYDIPEGVLKAGSNMIIVRISDFMAGGGFWGTPDTMFLQTSKKKHSLAGRWHCRPSVLNTDYGIITNNPNTYYSTLYNAMIAPLVRFRISGAVWYQGENNAWNAKSYRTLFPNMIRDWRDKWGYDFPFYWVQLANFMAEDATPSDSRWAELREAQSMTRTLPHTGEAVIIDIGNPTDIHPRNKQDVGLRLALQVLHKEYGRKDLVCHGPMMESVKYAGSRAEVRFDIPASELVVKDKYGYIRGFAVAGEDRVFHWAKAWIDGDVLIVESDAVKAPVAVRYAWADNPMSNLFNAAGLPAAPFRTDDWPGITR